MLSKKLPSACVELILDYYVLHLKEKKEDVLFSLRTLFYGNQSDILTRFFFPSSSRSFQRLKEEKETYNYETSSKLFMRVYERWVNTESLYINARIWHHQLVDGGRLRYI